MRFERINLHVAAAANTWRNMVAACARVCVWISFLIKPVRSCFGNTGLEPPGECLCELIERIVVVMY